MPLSAQSKGAYVAVRQTSGNDGPITIKKYANRRLYNTATSSYVTLDHLCQMVQDGVDFVVYDAKTGEDITRPVLTQIIVEEEAKGQNLLPINFLRQLIGFYGDSMQEAFGGMFPFGNLEEMSKQNMALFENAMKMFSPFPKEQADQSANTTNNGLTAPADAESLEKLKAQVDLLQKQIDAITKERGKR